jgi:hypothetical protein
VSTSAPVTAAPTIAASTIVPGPGTVSTAMVIATAAAAPEFTPSSPGSASGFFVSACIIAPAAPSARPTIRPTTVRGARIAAHHDLVGARPGRTA